MRRRASPQSDLAVCAKGVSPAELFAPPQPGRTTQALEELERLDPALLQKRWRSVIGRPAPDSLSRQLKIRILVFREQVARGGDIDAGTRCALAAALRDSDEGPRVRGLASAPRPGSVLVREHAGVLDRVAVLGHGYAWNGRVFASLSAVARAISGTNWNGRRFFGLDGKAKGDREKPPKVAREPHGSRKATSRCAGETNGLAAAEAATRAARTEISPP